MMMMMMMNSLSSFSLTCLTEFFFSLRPNNATDFLQAISRYATTKKIIAPLGTYDLGSSGIELPQTSGPNNPYCIHLQL